MNYYWTASIAIGIAVSVNFWLGGLSPLSALGLGFLVTTALSLLYQITAFLERITKALETNLPKATAKAREEGRQSVGG